MLFYTPQFLIFSFALFATFAVVKGDEPRKLVLLAASYIFYMAWNPAFIVLIAFSTAVDFSIGRRLDACEDPRIRKRWLWTSLLANLGLLGYFKYAGFFSANAMLFARTLGFEPGWTTLEVILPVGISFYTFQSLSYTIDVYRRELPPTRSASDFALFVAFFPTLVAGPIVRARDFLPQLNGPRRMGCDGATFFLILRGLVKKVLIADNLAVFADAIFADPGNWPSVAIWVATAAFTVQIYCDFSGYSDMAIGIARVLGFSIQPNFNHPYRAQNPADFWRRWHISLSSWLRDYVYIPLGGNRGAASRTLANLMLTMLLGGLWHGASWNFVLWGLFHGLALVLHRFATSIRQRRDPSWRPSTRPVSIALKTAAMLYFTMAGWILFRVQDIDSLQIALARFVVFDGRLALQGAGLGALPFFTTVALLGAFAALHIFSMWRGPIDEWLAARGLAAGVLISAVIGFAAFYLWPLGETPFLYFQF